MVSALGRAPLPAAGPLFSEAPLDRGGRYCRPSSNGSAAGNRLEEAILQGLFEAVERDAVAIWWYSRLPRPPVLADGPTAVSFAAERAALARLGWSINGRWI